MATNGSAGSSEGVLLSISQESYGNANEIISRVIRGRLPEIQLSDFEDLKQTVLIKIVQRLRESDADENNASDSTDSSNSSNSLNSSIRDFSGYVAGVTHNACNDFLRTKSPVRTLLKQSLRDLFARHTKLALWRSDRSTICGLSEWTGHSLPTETNEKISELYKLIEKREQLFLTEIHNSKRASTGLVFNILNHIGSPVVFDDLVNLIADLRGHEEYTFTSLDDETFADRSYRSVEVIACVDFDEARELLKTIWKLLQERSLNQRRTFLYTFADENGDSLLRRVFEDRVATINELTESLEISADHLLTLIEKTPLDIEGSAVELNESKANVSKWRHRVSESIWNRLEKEKNKK